MWAYVKDGNIQEIIRSPKSITIDNILHSPDIFRSWTWTELNGIGIYEVVNNTTRGDPTFENTSGDKFTWNSSENRVDVSVTVTEKSLNDITNEDSTTSPGLKTIYKQKCIGQANSKIKRFSWLIERKVMDDSKNIPSAVLTYCAAIRNDCDTICTAIDNASNMTEFKALFSNGTIDNWTDDANVISYVR